MTIRDLIEKIRGMRTSGPSNSGENRRDKYLESLRRERTMQFEEQEKKRLILEIAAYKKEQMKRNVWGVDNEENLLRSKRQGSNVLRDRSRFL